LNIPIIKNDDNILWNNTMTDTEHRPDKKEEEYCVECPAGLDECIECGACDHCGHDAALDESELPQNWLKFIEHSKTDN